MVLWFPSSAFFFSFPPRLSLCRQWVLYVKTYPRELHTHVARTDASNGIMMRLPSLQYLQRISANPGGTWRFANCSTVPPRSPSCGLQAVSPQNRRSSAKTTHAPDSGARASARATPEQARYFAQQPCLFTYTNRVGSVSMLLPPGCLSR